jgi:NADH:ubiquinone oxidoreductase subunit 4 (subunit M)
MVILVAIQSEKIVASFYICIAFVLTAVYCFFGIPEHFFKERKSG